MKTGKEQKMKIDPVYSFKLTKERLVYTRPSVESKPEEGSPIQQLESDMILKQKYWSPMRVVQDILKQQKSKYPLNHFFFVWSKYSHRQETNQTNHLKSINPKKARAVLEFILQQHQTRKEKQKLLNSFLSKTDRRYCIDFFQKNILDILEIMDFSFEESEGGQRLQYSEVQTSKLSRSRLGSFMHRRSELKVSVEDQRELVNRFIYYIKFRSVVKKKVYKFFSKQMCFLVNLPKQFVVFYNWKTGDYFKHFFTQDFMFRLGHLFTKSTKMRRIDFRAFMVFLLSNKSDLFKYQFQFNDRADPQEAALDKKTLNQIVKVKREMKIGLNNVIKKGFVSISKNLDLGFLRRPKNEKTVKPLKLTTQKVESILSSTLETNFFTQSSNLHSQSSAASRPKSNASLKLFTSTQQRCQYYFERKLFISIYIKKQLYFLKFNYFRSKYKCSFDISIFFEFVFTAFKSKFEVTKFYCNLNDIIYWLGLPYSPQMFTEEYRLLEFLNKISKFFRLRRKKLFSEVVLLIPDYLDFKKLISTYIFDKPITHNPGPSSRRKARKLAPTIFSNNFDIAARKLFKNRSQYVLKNSGSFQKYQRNKRNFFWVENTIKEVKIITQKIKKIGDSFFVITIFKHSKLKKYAIDIYCTKTCNTYLNYIYMTDLEEALSSMRNEKDKETRRWSRTFTSRFSSDLGASKFDIFKTLKKKEQNEEKILWEMLIKKMTIRDNVRFCFYSINLVFKVLLNRVLITDQINNNHFWLETYFSLENIEISKPISVSSTDLEDYFLATKMNFFNNSSNTLIDR